MNTQTHTPLALLAALLLSLLALPACTPEQTGGVDILGGLASGLDNTGIATSGLNVGRAAVKANQKLTPDQQYYLGRAVAANVLTQYPPYTQTQTVRYLNEVGATVAAASDMPYVFGGYRFILLDTDEVNAFSAPGAYIMITRGLLRRCETEDELAAVLAHEVAHIQREHAVKVIEKSRQGDLAKVLITEGAGHATRRSDVPIGQVAGVFGDMAGDLTQKLMVNGYSRESELEADADAVAILRRAGYEPAALTQVLARQRATMGDSARAGMGKTHPLPQQRLDKLPVPSPDAGPGPSGSLPSSARQQRFDAATAAARQ